MKKITYLSLIASCTLTITHICTPEKATPQSPSPETTCDQTNKRELELINMYKNYFMRIQNQIFSTSMTASLAQLKRTSSPDEFWRLFDVAVQRGETIVMHTCAREYIDRVGNPTTDSYFTQNKTSESIKDVIRKQYFLKTNDENILKKEDGTMLTLSLFEAVISRPTTIMNSKLNLSNLHLGSIDDIGIYNTIILEEIDLSNNFVSTLPVTLTTLPGLKYLNCSHNNLKDLSKEFKNLQHLKKLNLSYNKFETFPESLCELRNLWRLDMDHNCITKLPENINKLTSLNWLLLNDNQLEELPESISSLSNLHKLDLSNNQLKQLPKIKNTRIHLAGNLNLDNEIVPEKVKSA